MNIAIFASGEGSNFQALMKDKEIFPHVRLLVSDKPQAKVITRAKHFSLDVVVCWPQNYPDKKAYEQEILDALQKKEIDFIILAGYMRLIGPILLSAYPQKIINLHPSLLPLFKGKDAVRQAIEAGVNSTGVTAHFVDEGMDSGPVIAQEKIAIQKNDNEKSLTAKIHEVEHVFYPKVIKQFILKEQKS